MLSEKMAKLFSAPDCSLYPINDEVLSFMGCVKRDNGLVERRFSEWWETPSGERMYKGVHPIFSLDDAVYLLDATMPGAKWMITNKMAEVNGNSSFNRGTPSYMLCHAMVRAKEATI